MGPLHEKQLLEVVAGLCRFIMHEWSIQWAYFFSKDHELAMDSKYISLREWRTRSILPPQVALETTKKYVFKKYF
jgi:hypothetical protein